MRFDNNHEGSDDQGSRRATERKMRTDRKAFHEIGKRGTINLDYCYPLWYVSMRRVGRCSSLVSHGRVFSVSRASASTRSSLAYLKVLVGVLDRAALTLRVARRSRWPSTYALRRH